MGKTATGSEPRELIPAKNYAGVICGVYEIGTQTGQYGPQNQWIVMFGVHSRKTGNPIRDKRGEIQTISEFLNFYLGTPAKPSPLLKLIQAAERRTFTADEIKAGYDLEQLIDRSVELKVVHKLDGKGQMRARIETVSALDPEEDEIPKPALDASYWDIPAGGWDGDVPETVPKFVRDFIGKSEEYRKATAGKPNGKGQTVGASVQSDDEEEGRSEEDDIPF